MEKLNMKEIVNAAKTEEGVWVTIVDVIATAFKDAEASESVKKHLGRIRISDKIEILEIIDDVPQVHIYNPKAVDITDKNGKTQFSTREWETEITYDGSSDKENYISKTLDLVGTSREEYKEVIGTPTVELLFPSPR